MPLIKLVRFAGNLEGPNKFGNEPADRMTGQNVLFGVTSGSCCEHLRVFAMSLLTNLCVATLANSVGVAPLHVRADGQVLIQRMGVAPDGLREPVQ